MIIYNGKAIIVAIPVIAIFFLFAYFDWFITAFIVSGIVGLICSVLITGNEEGKGCSSYPSIFFIPTHVYSLLIIGFGIIGIIAESDDKPQDDYSVEQVEYKYPIDYDVDTLLSSKFYGNLSVSKKLDSFMIEKLPDIFKADEFSYLIKEKDSSVLLLVNKPEVKFVHKRFKSRVSEEIEFFINESTFFVDKNKYIGLYEEGELIQSFMLDKTNNKEYIDDVYFYNYYE